METKHWMGQNMLKLNEDKTEIMIVVKKTQNHLSQCPAVTLGDNIIKMNTKVKNLGVVLDSHLSIESQVSSLYRTLMFELKKIGSIRSFISLDTTKKTNHFSHVCKT